MVAAIEAQAAAKVADASSTAAVEAVAGMLSHGRWADADVIAAEGWAAEAVTPFWLMQVGRSLIREGASLSVIEMRRRRARPSGARRVLETLSATTQTGGDLEDGWEARVTTYGPGSSHTRLLARSPARVRPLGHVSGHPLPRAGSDIVGASSPPASRARSSGRWAMRPPVRSRTSCRCRKTAATAPTTTRSRR